MVFLFSLLLLLLKRVWVRSFLFLFWPEMLVSPQFELKSPASNRACLGQLIGSLVGHALREEKKRNQISRTWQKEACCMGNFRFAMV